MKNKNSIISLFLTLLLLISLGGCTKENVSNEYITFTHTYTVSEDTFSSEVYQYKVGSKEEPILIADVPYTSQYPLTVYDEARDKVYYTSRIPNTKIDQIFEYDPKTKEQVQITDTLGAINYMVPLERGLFVGALPLGADDIFIRPYLLDYKSKKLTEIPFDAELSINNLIYDQNKNTIFMSVHNQVLDRIAIQNQDKEEYVPPENTIMSIDVELNIKELTKTPRLGLGAGSLSILDDILYIQGYKKDFSDIKTYQVGLVGLNQELEDISVEGNELVNMIGLFIGVDESNTLIYYINGSGQLSKYNKDKKEKRVIFTPLSGKSTVNNGLLLKSIKK